MKTTENLKLKKPELTDYYDVDDFNGNADIIDEEIHKVKTSNASHTAKGMVQLRQVSGKDHSGLKDHGNGVISININGGKGTQISGSNELYVVAADEVDIDSKSNPYKPIVPLTLSYAVQSITGQLADLYAMNKGTFTEAINENTSDITNLGKQFDRTVEEFANSFTTKKLIVGVNNTVTEDANASIGYKNNVSGIYSVALGGGNLTVSGNDAVAIGGGYNTATGESTIMLGGSNNTGLAYQIKGGNYAKDGTAGNSGGTTGDAFILGNGTNSAKSNCFRVAYDGYVYGGKTFGANAADYAEMFEWLDGNPNNEDRRGLFVTLDGEKIRLATAGDSYIVGVVSAQPAVLGDVYSDEWQGMYIKDVFGAYKKDENGNYMLNPEYDTEKGKNYVSRESRPEWSAIGMLGKLVVVDDGTAVVNGYCTAGADGKATAAETGYRVLARIDETHIKILFR